MRLLFLLTNFGDPILTAPLAFAVLSWLAATGRRRAALAWAFGFACAAGVVAMTKFVYAGWGIGIAAWRFTGVSGHTMLGAAVYPLVAAICVRDAHVRRAIAAGLAFALAIGMSRVLLGFHSWSEIVTGWLLGAAVAVSTARCLRGTSGMQAGSAHAARNVPMSRRECGIGIAHPRASASAVAARRAARVSRSTILFAAVACTIAVSCYGRSAPVSAWISHAAPKVAEWSRVWLDDAR
ncbi:phosphatase PAP2 family protein [Burkholderia humptydooensis]|uniref:Phosphatase PAP2 family protein n=2 Tax=Burkholderia humptydooensis TaxID=430531 RepID=A0A7U4P697_9BURK|nr:MULTISPECIES: phosphatase PAP2 family protein [Burkholderia]AJY43854.1 PAP2 superfamily protein [Burkholderia sp. 2002721687]ALX43749.1 phosphoesterase [Burkholderia humptydooensis]EIP89922.1 PAP2 family protein [Burkholderia humptydooensis MSMB43]QPS44316.1 phosphatase PAP2 family protein [Burkholderia humptydooensis]